ncbi:class B sortase [Ruminococcus sp.]|uniref:class B sortase n=1 Tax=Ruminococcus sp. TaxID=41978 RepID=UPI00258A2172|nr:class B sortase [Ruminococcus sp.]MCR5020264.1 class B sortase [Ruminococcus sp.]
MNDSKKSGSFAGLLKYFIPWKGDKSSEIVRKIVFIASVGIFCVSLGQLKNHIDTVRDGKDRARGVIDQYEPKFDDNIDYEANTGSDNVDIAEPDESYRAREVQKWVKDKKLLERNDDVIGWIKIPGFVDSDGDQYMSFPVLQGKDNDEYLYKDIDGNYYESGSIFADAWSVIGKERQSDNITIFGHHMGWVGTNFTHLSEYEQGADFVKDHAIIEFNSIYESKCKYAVVSCFIINTDEKDDNGELWEYIGYRDFTDDQYRFDEWYNEITRRSWYSSDIKCTENDKYITLSTCSKLTEEGLRWVIVAKKLTPDDDIDAIEASYKDKAGKDIYFPQLWKDNYGNKTVYKGWQY